MLRGVATSGLRKAGSFTQLPWVARQFAAKLRLRAWPGTFNVRITDALSQSLWDEVRMLPGTEIEPPDASACVARCYPVLVNEQVKGAIVLPHVAGYPPDQIEIIAEERVRARLDLHDGDPVILRIFAGLRTED